MQHASSTTTPALASNFSFYRINNAAGVYTLPVADNALGYLQFGSINTLVDPNLGASRKNAAAFYVKAEGPSNFIKNSSIYNGIGWCVHCYSSDNVDIENNVFFNCEKHLTRALFANNFTFVSNLLIAPRKRNLNSDSLFYDMVSGLDMYTAAAKHTGSNLLITKNLVQGGDGNGFVMPGYECGETNIGFRG